MKTTICWASEFKGLDHKLSRKYGVQITDHGNMTATIEGDKRKVGFFLISCDYDSDLFQMEEYMEPEPEPMFFNWDEIKDRVHDISGVTYPELQEYREENGIYYPFRKTRSEQVRTAFTKSKLDEIFKAMFSIYDLWMEEPETRFNEILEMDYPFDKDFSDLAFMFKNWNESIK